MYSSCLDDFGILVRQALLRKGEIREAIRPVGEFLQPFRGAHHD